MRRAEDFAKGLDAAEAVIPGIRQEILSENIKPTKTAVAAIARADPEERADLAKQLRRPRGRPETKDSQEQRAELIDDGSANEDPEDIPFDSDEETDLYGDEEDIPVSPIRIPKKSEILALAESMNHSEGQAIGTVEDMIFEMNSAMKDMIWRWNFCREAYVKPIRSRDGKRQIRDLAAEGIEYLKEVRKGALWKDEAVCDQ